MCVCDSGRAPSPVDLAEKRGVVVAVGRLVPVRDAIADFGAGHASQGESDADRRILKMLAARSAIAVEAAGDGEAKGMA